MIEVQPKQYQNNLPSRYYQFDRVFPPETTQSDFYTAAVSPLLADFLQGYNCSVFTYGQTGSGKSYSMYGPDSYLDGVRFGPKTENFVESLPLLGAIPRVIDELFRLLNKNQIDFQLRVSNVEVYNEDIFDLLVENQQFREPLKIYEERQSNQNARNKVLIQNITEQLVKTPQEVIQLLQKSNQNRKIAETKMNEHSSRSHSIFTIQLIQKQIEINQNSNQEIEFIKISKLNLVDLAGSESISKSGVEVQSMRQHEASKINKSLLTLGRVINSLVENQSFIPYRDSKLTRLLSDSLGGKTKTCIIATISLSDYNADETVNTLEYMTRAKKIKNMPEITQKVNSKTVLKEYSQELKRLQELLEAQRNQQGGVFIPSDEYQTYQEFVQNRNEKIKELEALIESLQLEMNRVQELQNMTIKKYKIVKNELGNAVEKYKQVNQDANLISDKLQLEREVILQNQQKYDLTVQEFNKNISQVFSKIQKLQNREQFNMNLKAVNDQIFGLYQSLLTQVSDNNSAFNSQLGTLTKQLQDLFDGDVRKQYEFLQQQIKLCEQQIDQFIDTNTKSAEGVKQFIRNFIVNVVTIQLNDILAKQQVQYHAATNLIQNMSQLFQNNNITVKNFINQVFDNMNAIQIIQKQYYEEQLSQELEKTINSAEKLLNQQQMEMMQKVQQLIDSNNDQLVKQLKSSISSVSDGIVKTNKQIEEKFNDVYINRRTFVGQNDRQVENYILAAEEGKKEINTQNNAIKLAAQQIKEQLDQFADVALHQQIQETIVHRNQEFQHRSAKEIEKIIQVSNNVSESCKQLVQKALEGSLQGLKKTNEDGGQQVLVSYKKIFSAKEIAREDVKYEQLAQLSAELDTLVSKVEDQVRQCCSKIQQFKIVSSRQYQEFRSQQVVQTPTVAKSPEVMPVQYPDDLAQSQLIYGVVHRTPTIK